jgi:serine/threonine protein kinase
MQTLGRPSYVDVEALRSPYARAMVTRTHTGPGPTLRSLVPKVRIPLILRARIEKGGPPDCCFLFAFMLSCGASTSLNCLSDFTCHPQASKTALDLLSRMLVFNPEKRITMEEALCHPYVAEFVGSG